MSNELGTLIGNEVARQETTFDTTRSRALTLTGVAGGFVAIVSGFLTLAVGSDGLPAVSEWAFVFLAVALGAFVLSTILTLIINFPRMVVAADSADLKKFVEKNWDDDDWEQSVAEYLVTYLTSLRAVNKHIARLLSWAIGLEVIGIAATAVVAGILGWRLAQ